MTPYFGFAMVLIASAMMYMVYKNEKSTELNIA